MLAEYLHWLNRMYLKTLKETQIHQGIWDCLRCAGTDRGRARLRHWLWDWDAGRDRRGMGNWQKRWHWLRMYLIQTLTQYVLPLRLLPALLFFSAVSPRVAKTSVEPFPEPDLLLHGQLLAATTSRPTRPPSQRQCPSKVYAALLIGNLFFRYLELDRWKASLI